MKKTNFTKAIILNKKFSNELSGYNPIEVDKCMDKIIEDYQILKDEIELLEIKLTEKNSLIESRDEKIQNLKIKIEILKTQLKESARASNYELLQEIKKLQKK